MYTPISINVQKRAKSPTNISLKRLEIIYRFFFIFHLRKQIMKEFRFFYYYCISHVYQYSNYSLCICVFRLYIYKVLMKNIFEYGIKLHIVLLYIFRFNIHNIRLHILKKLFKINTYFDV